MNGQELWEIIRQQPDYTWTKGRMVRRTKEGTRYCALGWTAREKGIITDDQPIAGEPLVIGGVAEEVSSTAGAITYMGIAEKLGLPYDIFNSLMRANDRANTHLGAKRLIHRAIKLRMS